MDDLISRQAAIDLLDALFENAFDYLCELPTAEPEPSEVARDIATIIENEQDMRVILSQQPKKGKWIEKPNIYGVAYCSECDYELHTNDTKYCPNCGARMEENE